MKRLSTITSKGQVVIPKSIRQLYSLKPQSKVIFEPWGEQIIIRPLGRTYLSQLQKKLAGFEVDKNFRKDWEATLRNRMKKWGW